MTDLMGAHKASLLDSTALGAGSIFGGNSPFEAAQRYLDLDYAILPIKADGTKAPAAPTWSGDLDEEFGAEDCRGKAVGIKCGRLSDNAYCLDFEDVPTFDLFCAEVANAGLSHLIASAPLAATPRPGRHLYLHLLERPDVGEGLAWDADGKLILESRGQGQYVVAPGSPAATHKSGQLYQWIREPSEDKNYLAATEFEALIAIAKGLDQSGAHERPTRESVKSVGTAHDKNSPGHDYNARGDHAELLGSHGFKMIGVKRDGTELWQKPNSSDRGHQLTFNSPECPDMLYCFSPTCPPFPVRVPMDKFGIYARLEHNGDFKAAARQLGEEGYGDQKVVVESKKPEGTGQTPCAQEDGWTIEDKPLFRPLPQASEFPVDALGDILGGAARVIQSSVQAPLGMCSQAVLASAALAAQGHANVAIDGRSYPLSNYFITLGETGERKSAVDRLAADAASKYEDKLKDIYQDEMATYELDTCIYEAEKRKILKGKEYKNDSDGMRKALKALTEPEAPIGWKVITQEPTAEGLFKMLQNGQPIAGIYCDEGGRFLGGIGMHKDNMLKMIAFLSKVWDGDKIDRVRSGDGVDVISGRRASLHLFLQPGLARTLVTDKTVLEQGFSNRLLYCYPQSTIGTRQYHEFNPGLSRELDKYNSTLLGLLEAEKPLREGSKNELAPRSVELSPAAKRAWIAFHNDNERAMERGGAYEEMRGYASKVPEHALRLSGILALINDPGATEISDDLIDQAVELMRFYTAEAERLFGSPEPSDFLKNAQKVYEWLLRKGADLVASGKPPEVAEKDIYQNGPKPVRSARAAQSFMTTLAEHGKIRLGSKSGLWLVRLPEPV